MALNYIWFFFFAIAFVVALVKVIFLGDTTVFNDIIASTFEMAETSVNISIYLIGVMSLWLGIMKIGEQGGAVQFMIRLVSPFFVRIFPDIPKNHPAMGSMLMNFSANMLGLDNAATPMGLKAMKQLQELNPNKDTATNSQIMFLVLNTSGLTLIPVSVMAFRAEAGALNAADIFIPILLATYFSSLIGLIAASIVQKINLFDKVILSYILGATALVFGLLYYISGLSQGTVDTYASLVGNTTLFSIITAFLVSAFLKKVNVYSVFIDGAKEGFTVAIKIIPYLVAMLVAIGVFRASGALDYITDGMGYLFAMAGLDTRFVEALPTAFMKPLSGSGARGMMVEAMRTHGADSFVGRLSSIFQGSTETTFYTVAVYYGAVAIKNTRNTIGLGLLADLAGIIAAIFICYIFFG